MVINGDTLRRLRENAGLSVRQLADQAQVSPGYVSLLENHHRSNPTPPVCARLAAALDCSIADLRAHE